MAKHWVYDDERLKNVTQPGWSLLRPSAHLPTAFFPGPFPWWGLGEGGSSTTASPTVNPGLEKTATIDLLREASTPVHQCIPGEEISSKPSQQT